MGFPYRYIEYNHQMIWKHKARIIKLYAPFLFNKYASMQKGRMITNASGLRQIARKAKIPDIIQYLYFSECTAIIK
jgi:hypothetical protein